VKEGWDGYLATQLAKKLILEFIKVDSGFGLKEIKDKLEVCRGEKLVAASVAMRWVLNGAK